MSQKTVILADDHLLFLKGLEELLNKEPGIKVINAISNGSQVIQAVSEQKPDVLVLDLNLKTTNGFVILEQLKNQGLNPMVVFLTMYTDQLLIDKAMKLGAQAFLLKETDPVDLVEIIENLDKNSFIVSDKLKKNNTNGDLNSGFTDDFEAAVKITSREREILRLIAEGKPAKTIAETLFISPSTVDTHRKNMMKKLNLNKISELVAYAHRNAII